VTNLLDLSRLQAGVLSVFTRPLGLEDVVNLTVDHLGVPLGSVEVDVPTDLPEVQADPGLLDRVVANVVQNALRYSPDGTPVRVAGSAHGELVELRVIDLGPGIPRPSVSRLSLRSSAATIFRPVSRPASDLDWRSPAGSLMPWADR
jgi:two-component system sensor histidine kinase KdpD